eukprot:m.219453 g.219453  ORF g.219453 m.219453 type:complete len:120 (+) comp39923_c1_seq9:294-653(+)
MHAVTLSNWNERNQVRDSSNVQLSSVKESICEELWTSTSSPNGIDLMASSQGNACKKEAFAFNQLRKWGVTGTSSMSLQLFIIHFQDLLTMPILFLGSYHTRSQKGRTVFPGTYTVPLR